MILTCPSCRTRYQADSSRFVPPGRNVRCAKCGQVWFQPAPEIEPEPEAPLALEPAIPPPPGFHEQPSSGVVSSEPATTSNFDFTATPAESETVVSTASESAPRRSFSVPRTHVAAWAALILLVAGIGWSVVQFRQTIANLWPPSASFYAAIGMPVNLRGLALVNINYQQEFEDGQPVLSVTGKLVNISDHELAVPGIRVVLTDDAKHELYHWTFDAGISSLKAGAESNFVTRLSSPPPEARNLNIRLADFGETQ